MSEFYPSQNEILWCNCFIWLHRKAIALSLALKATLKHDFPAQEVNQARS
jgi:hypothetical protein